MKTFSIERLSDLVTAGRRGMKLSQAQLAERTGLNRATISKIEQKDYTPSIPQLQALSQALQFDMTEVFVEEAAPAAQQEPLKRYNIAVAGTGYVGLSIATLLAQHNHVTAVDIIPEKVELINNRKSPIQDDYIEMYLSEKDLDLTALAHRFTPEEILGRLAFSAGILPEIRPITLEGLLPLFNWNLVKRTDLRLPQDMGTAGKPE